MLPPPRLRRLVLLIVLVSLAALFAAWRLDARDPAHALRTAVPGLERDLARHLASDPPGKLAAYCDDLSAQDLLDAAAQLADVLDCSSAEAFAASLEVVLPPLERLARVLSDRGHSRGPLELARYLRATPQPLSRRTCQLKNRIVSSGAERGLPADARYAFHAALADSVSDCLPYAAVVESRLVELAADAGDHERKRHHLRRGIALARRSGQYPLLSQLLGTACDDQLTAGHRDSAQALADEALDVALGAGLPLQAARVHYIFGAHHGTRGELSLASEHFDEAVAVARRFNAGYVELRFLLAQLRFHANLDCWDLVGRSLPRVDVLVRQVPELTTSARSDQLHTVILRLKAGYHAGEGRSAVADSLHAAAHAFSRGSQRNYVHADVIGDWATFLLDDRQPERGVALALEGLAYARSEGLEHHVRRLHGLAARGLLDLGDLAAAESHRQAMAGTPPADEGKAFDDAVLDVRLAAARADHDGVVRHLDAALRHLGQGLLGWGTRVEMYLMLHRHDFFRQELHQHLAQDPADGLALELAWRDLRRYLLDTPAAEVSAAGFMAHGRQAREHLRRWGGQAGNAALVFAVVDGQLWRWSLLEGDLQADTLDPQALRPRLDQLAGRLLRSSEQPDSPWPAELVDDLAWLSGAVLPGWTGDRMGRLLLVTSAFLDRVPLEAANLAAGPDYRPLAAAWQVAYLRRGGLGATTGDHVAFGACVVGIPEASPSLRRQQPSLRSLPRVEAEARRAADLLPDVTLLLGGQAHHDAITAAMRGARIIYLAGHAAVDPEMPYRSFIPCAPARDGSDLAGNRLVVSDILAQDLGGCDLVVLSNCRSGAGRVTSHTVGPSLADAFLDAGSAAVLATRWPLDDALAERDLRVFLEHWRGGDLMDAWAALAAMQRQGVGRGASWLNYRLELAVVP
jgi:hypothetical protein